MWREDAVTYLRTAVNFHDGTEARMTTPFSSATNTGASTVVQDCSSCSRLTFTTATPWGLPSMRIGEER